MKIIGLKALFTAFCMAVSLAVFLSCAQPGGGTAQDGAQLIPVEDDGGTEGGEAPQTPGEVDGGGEALQTPGDGGNTDYITPETLDYVLELVLAQAEPDGRYTIEITVDEAVPPMTIAVPVGVNSVTLTLVGSAALTLAGNGSLFTVGSAPDKETDELTGGTVTLVLDGVTLAGHGNNTAPLVTVYETGALIMKGASAVTGNTSRAPGGGVAVYSGSFAMTDSARVSGNTVAGEYGNFWYGGGVYVHGGVFTMDGNAAISGNATGEWGGGLYAGDSLCTIGGNAAIRGNSADCGGGVFVSADNKYPFTLTGNAAIAGNTAEDKGGGLYSSFDFGINITGGVIYGAYGVGNESEGDNANQAENGGAATCIDGKKTDETVCGPAG